MLTNSTRQESQEDAPHRAEKSRAVRTALRERYVSRCDQLLLEPSRKVLEWLTYDNIDEPRLTGADCNLSNAKRLYLATSGNSQMEADPLEPLLDLFLLVPLVHVSFDDVGLHNVQVNKLLMCLLNDQSRSVWSLSSLTLYGNQVDATVFPLLLQVIETHPLLTVVRVDPSPHCHLAIVDQMCAANEAKCRHSFVQRKRADVVSSAVSFPPISSANMIEHAAAPTVGTLPLAAHSAGGGVAPVPADQSPRTGSDVMCSSLQSFPAAPTTSDPLRRSSSFAVPISTFLGSVKSWVHFFYPPGKDLPDAMCFFLVKHILCSLRSSSTTTMNDLMECLKAMEKHFVSWRSGAYTFSEDHQLTSSVEMRLDRCAHCDLMLEDRCCATSSQSKKLLDTLLMESELGSKCFVQDSSVYLEAVCAHLLSRFAQSSSSTSSVPFMIPPQLCSASCIKRFCRSIFCAASGFDHGVSPIPFVPGVPTVRQFPGVVEYDILLAASFSATTANGPLSVADPIPLYKAYIRQKQERSADEENVTKSFVRNISVTTALRDIINDHVPQATLAEDLLSTDGFFTSGGRFPTRGLCLADVFSSCRQGVPMQRRQLSTIPLSAGDCGKMTDLEATVPMAHSLSLRMSWSNNSPAAPRPFEVIRDYFLRGKRPFHGSNVVLGVKLRPSVFSELAASSSSSVVTPLLVSENEGHNKFGVPVALHVVGVELQGNIWYVVARYGGRTLFLDEACVDKGASRYGAFAFVEPSFQSWLLAIRASDPYSPLIASSVKALEPLERRVEMEVALMMMLHIDTFYSSTAAYAHRSLFTLPEGWTRVVEHIKELLRETQFVPAEHQIDHSKLYQIISWYRDGNLGRIANFWEVEAHPAFHAFAISACRHVFAQKKPLIHPCLQPFIPGMNHIKSVGDGTQGNTVNGANHEVWFIPRPDGQRLFTSGKFISSAFGRRMIKAVSSEQRDNDGYYSNILSNSGPLDLSVLQHASTAASLVGAGHRRYLTMELVKGAVRMVQLTLKMNGSCDKHVCDELPEEKPSNTNSTLRNNDEQESSLRFSVHFSDDGKAFRMCEEGSRVVKVGCDEAEYTIRWKNVGAHRWWCVAVDRVNHAGNLIHHDPGCAENPSSTEAIPRMDMIGWKYIPDAVSPLLIDYSNEQMFVLHHHRPDVALSIERPFLTTAAVDYSSGATNTPPYKLPPRQIAWETNFCGGSTTGGGYLAGACSQLCGMPEKAIALQDKLYCFRRSDVVALDRYSGQVITPASNIKEDSLCSYFPLVFQEQLLGGFECFRGSSVSPLLFLYNATHFGLVCPKNCCTVLPPSLWASLPGRSLTEVDAFGVSTNAQLVRDGHDPYVGLSFPFSEVDWCFPITSASIGAPKSETFMVSLGVDYIRWELEDPRPSAQIHSSSALAAHPCARTVPLLSLLDTLPMTVSTPALKDAIGAALARDQRGSVFSSESYPLSPTRVTITRHAAIPSNEVLSGARLGCLLDTGRSFKRTISNVDPDTIQSEVIQFIHVQLDAPVPLRGIILISNAGGSTFTLTSRNSSMDPWKDAVTARHDHRGVAMLWLDGRIANVAKEWGIRVDGPGLTRELLGLTVLGLRTTDTYGGLSAPVLPSFLEWDIGVPLELAAENGTTLRQKQRVDCLAVCASLPHSTSPVIAGIELRWLALPPSSFSPDSSESSQEPQPLCILRISCETDNNADEAVIVESFTVNITSDLNCIIPFRPRPIRQLIISRVDGRSNIPLLSAKCYLMEVPLRSERVPMVSKADDGEEPTTASSHLRMDPLQFAQTLVDRKQAQQSSGGNDVVSAPIALRSSTQHSLARSGSDYIISLSSSSRNSLNLLTRVSTRVGMDNVPVDKQRHFISERASLSFKDIANRWVVCAESFVASDLSLDFVWDSLLPDPAPCHWKISFVHGRATVRWVDVHFLNCAAISSVDGYYGSPGWSRLVSVSREHHSAGPSPLSLDTNRSMKPLLAYSGAPRRISTITLSVPRSSSAVGGLLAEVAAVPASSGTVYISAVDFTSGTHVSLWSGVPQGNLMHATWPPIRCSNIVISNLASNIGAMQLLLPTGDCADMSQMRCSLHHGVTDVPIPAFPATIPLAIGSCINIVGLSNPQLLSAIRVRSSEDLLQFQVAYLDETTKEYIPVCWVGDTVKDHWMDCRFAPYSALPTAWRIKCCACGARSPQGASELAYVDLSIEFQSHASSQQATPLDLSEISSSFATNATARHNATSQGALRQRYLGNVHSTSNASIEPYLRLGNFDVAGGCGGGGTADDWEKRSQVSTSSVGGLNAFAPFVFVAVDLRNEPRAFTAIELNVQTDTEFELEVQWSSDSVNFTTVAVHRQGDGRWSTSWANHGAHPFWRIVVSFAQLSSRTKKKSQGSTFGADVDEKLLLPYIRAVSMCSVERIVWSELDVSPSSNRSVTVPHKDLVAIRRAQLSDPRMLKHLNPLFRTSVPLGLGQPTRLRSYSVHDEVYSTNSLPSSSLFALWRAAVSKPSQALVRAAIAAEDHLQSTLPHLTNPQAALDKETASQVSNVFFGGVEFELSDASLSTHTNRITGDPSVVVQGTSVTGVRGIPPGTRVALGFEWANTSLIPSQPRTFVRSTMMMDRTWLSIQSEFSSIDTFSRFLPSIRETVFSDLSTYLVVYMLSKDDVHVGGHFPPLPACSGTSEDGSVEALLSAGVNVIATNIKAAKIVELFQGFNSLRLVRKFVDSVICGECCVTLHSPFESGSAVRLVVMANRTANGLDTDSYIVPRSLSLVIHWDGRNSLAVELVGDVQLPKWTSDTPYYLHGTLFRGDPSCEDQEASDDAAKSFVLALICTDEEYFTEKLLRSSPSSVSFRSVCGLAHLRFGGSTYPSLIMESLSLQAVLRFTRSLQVPCVLWPQCNDAALITLSTGIVALPRVLLQEFIEEQQHQETSSEIPVPLLLGGLGDFVGVGHASLSSCSPSTIEFSGQASWLGSTLLPCNVTFSTTGSPLVRAQVSVQPSVFCRWGDDVPLLLADGRIEIVVDMSSAEACCIRGSFASSEVSTASLHIASVTTATVGSVITATVDAVVNVGRDRVPLGGTLSAQSRNIVWCPLQLGRLTQLVADAVNHVLPQHLVGLNSVIPVVEECGSKIRWSISGRSCGRWFSFVASDSGERGTTFNLIEKICSAITRDDAPQIISSSVHHHA